MKILICDDSATLNNVLARWSMHSANYSQETSRRSQKDSQSLSDIFYFRSFSDSDENVSREITVNIKNR